MGTVNPHLFQWQIHVVPSSPLTVVNFGWLVLNKFIDFISLFRKTGLLFQLIFFGMYVLALVPARNFEGP